MSADTCSAYSGLPQRPCAGKRGRRSAEKAENGRSYRRRLAGDGLSFTGHRRESCHHRSDSE